MRAILVDDEPEVLEHLTRYMEQVPEIIIASPFTEPHKALDYTKENPVDVAFLDIEMHGMSGIELAKRIKDARPEVNIIFVTSYEKYAMDAFRVRASDYLLKPTTAKSIRAALLNLRRPVRPSNARIRMHTFGNFEVFVNGKPLQIKHTRAKELLAFLVDKRGASVTKRQIAAMLWEDRMYDRSIQKQTQTVIAQMMKTLDDAGISDIIIKSWNNLAVDVSGFDCDYYRFLEGSLDAVNSYTGEYMSQYSWAEMTAGMLTYKK